MNYQRKIQLGQSTQPTKLECELIYIENIVLQDINGKPSSWSPPHSWLNVNQAESSTEQEIVNYYIIT